VAAARDRLLDVERRGEDSGGGAAVGVVVGRRVEGQRRAAGRCTWPGRGGGMQQRRSRGDRDWGR
jgi:hypothetical protein